MLCSGTKVLILFHQPEIDIVVGETHLKQTVKTVSHIAVLNGVLLDPGDVNLFWCGKLFLLLG